MKTLAFIGGGNMAGSMIGGLIADGMSATQIRVSDPQQDKLDRLHSRFGVQTSTSNEDVAAQADALVFAVKPQVFKQVATQLNDALATHTPLIISIAAGIRCQSISQWLGKQHAIVRAMPNTPALVQSAATALVANTQVTAEQRDLAESVMRAIGVTVWLEDESLMDAVTALSGSGPAYFFLVMELMEKAGVKMGLAPDVASLLTLQTAFGSAKMALESPESVETLRKFVTSPGGTTEQAINVFQQNNIQHIFNEALATAKNRSNELAGQLGDD